MIKSQSFVLPFIKREQIASNTFSFFFDRSQHMFDFLPGQYLRMTIPHEADDRGTSRYFTIASSPLNKKHVMIATKLIQSSFKEALHSLTPGMPVQFFGPMGWFLLPKDEAQEKVFIAGGIGITPFHSLLHVLSRKSLAQPITLFASFAMKEEVIFYEELQQLAQKNKQIRVVYTITNDEPNINWQGEKGRLSKALLEKYLIDIQKPVFYLVGSAKMVQELKELLLSFEVVEEKIQTEDFEGY